MERLHVFDCSNVLIASFFTDDRGCAHENREHTLIYLCSGELEIEERGRKTVLLGFIFTTIGSIIGMFLTPMLGLPMILPGVMSNFFAGGTAGIFANQVGGRRGTIIGCIAQGIFIMILPALLSPMLGQIGFQNMTCTDVDTVVTGFFFMIIKSIAGIF